MPDRLDDLTAAIRWPLEWLDRQDWLWRYIARRLAVYRRPPPQPKPPTVRFRSTMMGRELRFIPLYAFAELDPDAGVESKELSLTVDGAPGPGPIIVAAEATEAELGAFKLNQQVEVTEVDIDEVGNRSVARLTVFTVLDTEAPPQPGAPNVSFRSHWVDVPDVSPGGTDDTGTTGTTDTTTEVPLPDEMAPAEADAGP